MQHLQRAVPAAALAAVLILVTACGGGGSGGRHANPGGFFLRDFGTGFPVEVRLDQDLTFVFSDAVLPSSVTHETIRIRDGANRPRGIFVRGVFLLDVDSGTRVVIDPDQIGAQLLERIEKTGSVDLVPDSIRYDLGATSDLDGRRQTVFDRGERKIVIFIPEVPERPDLSDLGLQPATTYTVDLPTDPAGPTLESEFGRRIRTNQDKALGLTFTTVALSDPDPFIGGETEGRPRIVHMDPAGGSDNVPVDRDILLRFSHPLDPRTVTPGNISLEIASVPGRPPVPIATALTQSRLGTVQVRITPLIDLAGDEYYELTVTNGVADLPGNGVQHSGLSFSTGSGGLIPDLIESFESKAMEDAAQTTADWNGSIPGALVAADGAGATSNGVSLWYDRNYLTPDYGTPEIDLDPQGGTILILVQGSREDVTLPGAQPVDPAADPFRLHTTDWVSLANLDAVDNFQYLRFRVEFTVPAGWLAGDPLPVVTQIRIPAQP